MILITFDICMGGNNAGRSITHPSHPNHIPWEFFLPENYVVDCFVIQSIRAVQAEIQMATKPSNDPFLLMKRVEWSR